ncbi:hypothetical protein GCM10025868_11870 [Angustibacter aerolatus]|uniref:FAD-binding domain-containing protein n=1 Tax=Angustibacter aerolatus TaxID=1162965 RepID=A0ABQ6JG86_9ACTN|nr:hypothetical protein GCM10025868_11870 [Angustibacter aerolatus]
MAGVPFRGIRYVDGSGREARALFTDGTGRGVRRTTLQPALLQAARDAGVEVRTGRVTGVRQDVEGVDASLADGTGLRTRWLVAADGLHSPCARRSGSTRRCAGGPGTACAGTSPSSRGPTWSRCTGPATPRRT